MSIQAQTPIILRTVTDLRAHVAHVRMQGKRIALVPTMGALHDGHMALVREGLTHADHVIATIFVNPTQFGPNEDFSAYPRTWDADLKILAQNKAGAVFHPATAEMYPAGAATTVSVHGITDHLDGPVRPGHFDGVATIVTKLLLQASPDIALFGEKDYQQLQVIKRLTQDLNIPVRIIGVPTSRDAKGLALSSRNTYLSAAEYDVAVKLNGILFGIQADIRKGMPWHDALTAGRFALDTSGFNAIDYLEVRDAASLAVPPHDARDHLRILAAVRIGKTRLIDNIGVDFMNLYIRLLILLLTSWRRPRVTDIVAGCSIKCRVLPNDLDTNMHMNNGRYLTVMDLGRMDLVLRAGLMGAMLKRGCLPVLASASVRWRLPLILFRPYNLETRVVCWDEKWVYLEQRFVMEGGKKHDAVAAIGILKGSFWDKKTKETVPTSELLAILGLDRASPPMPDHIVQWQKSEDALKAVTAA